MREATLDLIGNFDIDQVLQTAIMATGADKPGVDLIVIPGERGVKRPPNQDVILFFGDYIDDALLTAARAINKAFPEVTLLAGDEVGNDVDWASPETVTPFTYPEPVYDNQSNTVAVNIPTKIIPIIEISAKKKGHSIPEEISEWVTERALSAA